MYIVTVEFALKPGAKGDFQEALDRMHEQVKLYDGFLGEEPCRSLEDDSKYVTLFYFRDEKAVKAWAADPEHQRIQKLGQEKIFTWYKIQIANIERAYDWSDAGPT